MTGPRRPTRNTDSIPPSTAAAGSEQTDPASAPVTSLVELARHLNLAKGTVSRALNGYSDIAPATRARVAAAAEALGYRASTTARRLAQRRAEAVGLVVPAEARQFNSPFLAEFLSGLTVTLGRAGYDLVVRSAVGNDLLSDYSELMASRKVDAFVVTRTRPEDPRVAMLMAADMPFVTHGRTAWGDRHAWFDVDGEGAFRTATNHLLALGHRRIAVISAGSLMMASDHRLAGYRGALAEAGIAPTPGFVIDGDLTAEGGARAAATLLDLPAPPTAILCANDVTAVGAIHAIREAGLHVPHDVSVIGYDGISIGAMVDPPLTTMTQDAGQAGARVADMLLAVLSGEDPTDQQQLAQAWLIRRASDGPPPNTAGPTNNQQIREDTDDAQAAP